MQHGDRAVAWRAGFVSALVVVTLALPAGTSGAAGVDGADGAVSGNGVTTTFRGLEPGVKFGPAAVSGATTTGPSLTVNPNTNLQPGQTVSVTGRGFTPATGGFNLVVAECQAGATSTDNCAFNTAVPVSPDGTGSFTVSMAVQRTLSIFGPVGSPTVRCDTAPGACAVTALSFPAMSPLASADLGFDPNAARPSLTVKVRPRKLLLDGQRVVVRGYGFRPESLVTISQCIVGGTNCVYGGIFGSGSGQSVRAFAAKSATGPEPDGIAVTRPDGTFITHFTVALRAEQDDGSTTHCLAVRCELRATDVFDPDYEQGLTIAFDPAQPTPTIPQLKSTPAKRLDHGQVVTVRGHGFVPGADALVSECPASEPQFCDEFLTSTPVGPDGEFTVDVALTRLVSQFAFSDTPTIIDCAVVPCVLTAEGFSTTGPDFPPPTRGVTPISFDAAVPAPSAPVVTVTPRNNLPYQAVLGVHGTGFTPGEEVRLGRCESGPSYGSCSYGGAPLVANSAGVVDGSIAVRRSSGFPGSPDCADHAVVCAITVSGRYRYEDQQIRLGFDRSSVPPPPPTFRVRPRLGLGARQEVKVTGTGFLPGDHVYVTECLALPVPDPNDPESGAPCVGFAGATIDATGGLDTAFTVRRMIDDGLGGTTDCATTFGTCVVVVQEDFGGAGIRRRLGFDPNSVPPPPPTASVDPSVGLRDGDTVHIVGDGFAPNEYILITECRAGATSFVNCAFPFSFSSPGPIQADGTGHVQAEFVVHSTAALLDGTIDCRTAPGTCAVTVINQSVFSERAAQPISFR